MFKPFLYYKLYVSYRTCRSLRFLEKLHDKIEEKHPQENSLKIN